MALLTIGKLSHGEGRDLPTFMDHFGTPESHGMLGQVGEKLPAEASEVLPGQETHWDIWAMS